MNLVMVNVKLGENDPEPELHPDPVSSVFGSFHLSLCWSA